MYDKEYTYDIDKYTIGVDTNGEDGIGMTVAKVENGEIYFLGNCYGENARCIDLLIKENQKLKEQNKKEFADYIKFKKEQYDEYLKKINKLIKEKQELKKQVDEYKKDIKDLDNQNKNTFKNIQLNQLKVCNMAKQQKEFIKYLEKRYKDVTSVIGSYGSNTDLLYGKKYMLEEILQKYKEIIGAEDDTNRL